MMAPRYENVNTVSYCAIAARTKSDQACFQTCEMGDYLVDAAYENWQYIQMMYRRFEDRRPVILLDIQDGRIYAYPYAEFMTDLSKRSQRTLRRQHGRAVQENKIVVFVRDNEQRRLVSFLMDS